MCEMWRAITRAINVEIMIIKKTAICIICAPVDTKRERVREGNRRKMMSLGKTHQCGWDRSVTAASGIMTRSARSDARLVVDDERDDIETSESESVSLSVSHTSSASTNGAT